MNNKYVDTILTKNIVLIIEIFRVLWIKPVINKYNNLSECGSKK